MEGITATGSLSILAYANKQPELALQLLQKSLAGIAPSPNPQSPAPAPAPTSANSAESGGLIDIRA